MEQLKSIDILSEIEINTQCQLQRVLMWAPPEADAEAKIRRQIVHLGGVSVSCCCCDKLLQI